MDLLGKAVFGLLPLRWCGKDTGNGTPGKSQPSQAGNCSPAASNFIRQPRVCNKQ